MIKELFASKKFVSALISLVTMVAIKLGVPETDITELVTIVSPMLAYIGAQGFADLGKERAKVDAAAPPKVQVIRNERDPHQGS
jgi:hypothetical protein